MPKFSDVRPSEESPLEQYQRNLKLFFFCPPPPLETPLRGKLIQPDTQANCTLLPIPENGTQSCFDG